MLPNLERLDLTGLTIARGHNVPYLLFPSLHTLLVGGWLSDQRWDVPHLVRLELSDTELSHDAPLLRALSESVRHGVKMLTFHRMISPIRDVAHAFPNIEVLHLLVPLRIQLWEEPRGDFPLLREIGLALLGGDVPSWYLFEPRADLLTPPPDCVYFALGPSSFPIFETHPMLRVQAACSGIMVAGCYAGVHCT